MSSEADAPGAAVRVDEPRLSVAAVARRLGIAPATLRTWDRRYGLGPSGHITGRHRRYGKADLARLEVMRRAVQRGAPAGEAARYARSVPLPPVESAPSTEPDPGMGWVIARGVLAPGMAERDGGDRGARADTFATLIGGLAHPTLLVTARVGTELAGCVVGFACPTSVHPPRFLVCLARNGPACRVAQRARRIAVHLVPPSAQAVVELFDSEPDDAEGQADRFARCRWRPGPGGTPILQGCGSWFIGQVLERFALGDHLGFQLEPVITHRERDPDPEQPVAPGLPPAASRVAASHPTVS